MWRIVLGNRMRCVVLGLSAYFASLGLGCSDLAQTDTGHSGQSQTAWISQGEATVVPGNHLLRLQHARGIVIPFATGRPKVATLFTQWASPSDPSKGHAMIRLDSPMFIENSQLNRFGDSFSFTGSPETNVRIDDIASVNVRPCPAYVIDPSTGRMTLVGTVQGPTQLYNREKDFDWVGWNGQLVAVPVNCTTPFDQTQLIKWGANRDLSRQFRLLSREDSPITYGWEVESSNTDIVNAYKMSGYTDEQWLATSYDKRAGILRDELKKASERVIDYVLIKTTSFVKMSHAPRAWSTGLTAENAYIWELISEEPVSTFGALLEQLQTVRMFNGNTHIHMAFSPPTLSDELTITRFKTLFILGNLYILLRSYGDTATVYGGRSAAFLNTHLDPIAKTGIGSLDVMLRTADHPANLQLKWHMLGYRVLRPYPGMLHGLEVRGLGKNIEEQLELAWRLVSALEDLSQPVRLHTAAPESSGYLLDDHAESTMRLLEPISVAACIGIVDALRCKYAKRRGLALAAIGGQTFTHTDRLDLPYQNWEFLPVLSPATDLILSARSTYEYNSVEVIRTTDMTKGHELLGYRWMNALIVWATSTRLWEHF